MNDVYILGIESSCDETAISVVKNGRQILSNVVNSQIPIHTLYGGVVPEIASRNHIDNISLVMEKAISDARISLSDITAIGCTYGPGLVGALLVGLSYGKALSYALKKPLVGVNHIEGHIAANYITHYKLEPPFLCIMMSGGNTQIVNVKSYTEFEVLGRTRDDAIGEAFDKVARVVGLGYPGGPKIDKLAEEGQAVIELPKTHMEGMDFSFSGIKTAVINLHHKEPDIDKANLCKSFEKAITDMLMEKVKMALKISKCNKIVLAGGVSANTYIRSEFEKLKEKNIEVYMPDLTLH